ncbi:nuclear transport factor 2 family protein [Duganella callida]|uniref:Nuclear transport factor 2 family protein n=1 Tax=Duganella callida TaxID=2561932 RepID=A0A4Y9SCD6_9BURK|nr:nuclear transport factor 2 family protein [Duganella callida]TFW17429.1 nuclear transport factor 2 family protein [Duganella callida]
MNTDLDRLLDWYATLTPHSIGRAAEFYAPDAHFRDPFNDVRGVAAIQTVLRHMFEHTERPRFIIGERLLQGQQGFATWTFVCTLRGKEYRIAGGSHFRFDADGRAVLHRDYWDAAEELLQKLPLFGAPIRWLRRRFRATM